MPKFDFEKISKAIDMIAAEQIAYPGITSMAVYAEIFRILRGSPDLDLLSDLSGIDVQAVQNHLDPDLFPYNGGSNSYRDSFKMLARFHEPLLQLLDSIPANSRTASEEARALIELVRWLTAVRKCHQNQALKAHIEAEAEPTEPTQSPE